jgi:hypothetical protein
MFAKSGLELFQGSVGCRIIFHAFNHSNFEHDWLEYVFGVYSIIKVLCYVTYGLDHLAAGDVRVLNRKVLGYDAADDLVLQTWMPLKNLMNANGHAVEHLVGKCNDDDSKLVLVQKLR